MGKDPAFLFYPGDYLRDTQCLSPLVNVAYDRIMCEQWRNITITKPQFKLFTKLLNDDEVEELKTVLIEDKNGYKIEWVAESIIKRRGFVESRRKNRKGKTNNISNSYDKHKENENENEEEKENGLISHTISKTEKDELIKDDIRDIVKDVDRNELLKRLERGRIYHNDNNEKFLEDPNHFRQE